MIWHKYTILTDVKATKNSVCHRCEKITKKFVKSLNKEELNLSTMSISKESHIFIDKINFGVPGMTEYFRLY